MLAKAISKIFLILLTVIIFQSLILVNISSTFAVSPAPIQWSKTYGGTGDEVAAAMIKTNDGNYAIAGTTTSYGAGGADFWLIKIDANGNLLWNKTYGGTGNDNATSLVQTNDGGYAIAGTTNPALYSSYMWLVKTDSNGNMQWNQTFEHPPTNAMIQTNDGGYALGGWASAGTGLVFVKTDSVGNMQWNITRFSREDEVHSIIQANDGGYGITGTSYVGANDLDRLFFVKLNSTGARIWGISSALGLPGYDFSLSSGYAAVQTRDGGYAVVGRASGVGGQYPNAVGYDYLWLIKLDSTGNIVWNTTYAAATISSIIQTSDDGYALAGSSGGNFLLVKTDSLGKLLWTKTFGGLGNEGAKSIFETVDGGYILGGSTTSYGAGGSDFWIVKVPINSLISSNDNYDNLWHTTNVAITLTNNNPTNTQNIYYRINDGSTKTVSIDGQPTITSEGANNTLEYWSVDKSGLEEWPHKLITIKIDKSAPTGSIIINNGNISTASRSVTLTLTYKDTISNVSQVRYSNDNVWDTENWETPTPTKIWNLTTGDETKTVYYQIKDTAGLVGQTYSDSIDLRMKNVPSSLSLILDSETSLIGFKVNLNGRLSSNNVPIVNASILLSYSVTGGQSWNDIATVSTSSDGTYSAIWQPSATSTYLVKASFAPYFTYNDTQIIRMLSVNSFDNQNVFSVVSNSTVSALAFNSTSGELSFTVSGDNGTVGFVDLSIAKSLITNIADVTISLDGKTLTYTVTSTTNAWLLHFSYTHSTHNVDVELGTTVIPEFPSMLISSVLIMILLSMITIYKKYARRKLT